MQETSPNSWYASPRTTLLSAWTAFSFLVVQCGGAQSRARPSSTRRRRRNQAGAQTAKRRKAGSRVTAQGTFKGAGRALNEDVSDEEAKKAGSGFRKKVARYVGIVSPPGAGRK